MKLFLFALASNLPAITCLIASAVLAYNDKVGWGWFLFTGLLMFATVSNKSQ